MPNHSSTIIILLSLLFIVLFFLCRELICWYYKINERNNLLREIADNQKKTYELLYKIAEFIDQNARK